MLKCNYFYEVVDVIKINPVSKRNLMKLFRLKFLLSLNSRGAGLSTVCTAGAGSIAITVPKAASPFTFHQQQSRGGGYYYLIKSKYDQYSLVSL